VGLGIDGLLLVNKPTGLTSNAVLQQVKRLYKAKKAGHTGSLDPLATGMLPLCFGEATKFSQYLLDADKCYEVTGCLGIKTNTADSMGEIISSTDSFTVSEDELTSVLSRFAGPILQVPSMFSALKHQGKPLYKYAREGIDIERPAREVTIHKLVLNQFDGRFFSLTVTCSKGTYIRNLVEDIGEQLGVGAHVTRLHRLYTAGLSEELMFPLDSLLGENETELLSHLLPIDRAVSYLPKITIDLNTTGLLRQGKIISDLPLKGIKGGVRLYLNGKDFIGLGDVIEGDVLKVRRLLAAP
jgi:tRNA pseudouridine55 synthase